MSKQKNKNGRVGPVGVHLAGDSRGVGAELNAPEQVNVYLSKMRSASSGRLKRYRAAKVRNFVTAFPHGRFFVCDTPGRSMTPAVRSAFKKYNVWLTSQGQYYIGVFEKGSKSGFVHCHYLLSQGFNYSVYIAKWRSIIEPLFPSLDGKRVYARAEEFKESTREAVYLVSEQFEKKERVLKPAECRLARQLSDYVNKSLTLELSEYVNKDLYGVSDTGREEKYRSMVSSRGLEDQETFRSVKEFYSWMIPLSNLTYGYGFVNVKLLASQLKVAFVETFRRLNACDFSDVEKIKQFVPEIEKIRDFYAQCISYGSCRWKDLNNLQKRSFCDFMLEGEEVQAVYRIAQDKGFFSEPVLVPEKKIEQPSAVLERALCLPGFDVEARDLDLNNFGLSIDDDPDLSFDEIPF